MNSDDSVGPEAESNADGALVRLGLKVAFGTRGEYVVEYLDNRRAARIAKRVAQLSDFATVIGVDTDALIDQIEHDDGAAEFFERVVGIAAKSRHEPKLRYLARCLANFINTADDAAPDMSWARVEAVEDMEAIHLRLLHQVRAAQNRREEEAQAWLSGGAASDLPIAEATLIEDRRRDRKGLPAGSFQPIMAVLIRSGLVVGKLSVEVDLDVSIDLQDGSMDGSPEVRSEMMYRVTPLGLEVLELIGEQELGGS